MTPADPSTPSTPDLEGAVKEASALVAPHIVGAKHVRIRVVTLRRILSALSTTGAGT
jgi:hypothetical protein